MAFVYRYLSRQGVPQYIGKVSGDEMNCLASRINQHKSDFDGREKSWTIEYVDGLSAADADALETILISQLRPVLNKSKTNWGECKYFSEVAPQWKLYEPSPKFGRHELRDRFKRSDDEPHRFVCDMCKSIVEEPATWIFIDIKGPKIFYGTGATVCKTCGNFMLEKLDQVFDDFLRKPGHKRLPPGGRYSVYPQEV